MFACSDVVTKYLAMRYPVPLVLAIRYAVNLVLLLALFGPRYGRSLFATKRTGMVVFRAASLVVSSLCMGLALKVMPVAEAIAIVYLAPFGVLLLAGRVLGEKPTWQGWLAALIGFCGVLLICRPGAGLAPLGIVFALLTAAFTTVYFLLSRSLAASETTEAMLFYVALTGAIAFRRHAAVELVRAAVQPARSGAAVRPWRHCARRALSVHRRLPLCAGLAAVAGQLHAAVLGGRHRLGWCSAMCRTL